MSYTNNNFAIIGNILGMDTNAVQAELNILHELINSADRSCGYGIFNGLTLEQTIDALFEVSVMPRPIAGDRKFYPLGNGEKGIKLALIFKSLIWDEGNLTHPSAAEIAVALEG